jgi:hypothetical protein
MHNVFDEFLMLSNSQFIENRVYEEVPRSSNSHTPSPSSSLSFYPFSLLSTESPTALPPPPPTPSLSHTPSSSSSLSFYPFPQLNVPLPSTKSPSALPLLPAHTHTPPPPPLLHPSLACSLLSLTSTSLHIHTRILPHSLAALSPSFFCSVYCSLTTRRHQRSLCCNSTATQHLVCHTGREAAG